MLPSPSDLTGILYQSDRGYISGDDWVAELKFLPSPAYESGGPTSVPTAPLTLLTLSVNRAERGDLSRTSFTSISQMFEVVL